MTYHNSQILIIIYNVSRTFFPNHKRGADRVVVSNYDWHAATTWVQYPGPVMAGIIVAMWKKN